MLSWWMWFTLVVHTMNHKGCIHACMECTVQEAVLYISHAHTHGTWMKWVHGPCYSLPCLLSFNYSTSGLSLFKECLHLTTQRFQKGMLNQYCYRNCIHSINTVQYKAYNLLLILLGCSMHKNVCHYYKLNIVCTCSNHYNYNQSWIGKASNSSSTSCSKEVFTYSVSCGDHFNQEEIDLFKKMIITPNSMGVAT